jgi:hypothetical protein
MDTKHDALTKLLNDDSFRPILAALGAQLNIDNPVGVIVAGLSILTVANDERVAKGATLILQYPSGDWNEMVYWNERGGPKLVAKNGTLV